MNNTEKLKVLKEKGKMVVSQDYIIYYSPFTNTFFLDVPEEKKSVSFFAINRDCLGETFTYDMTGMYPYAVIADSKTYEEIWTELETYINGANTKLIPANYTSGRNEYIWVTTERNGLVAISRDEIITIHNPSNEGI